MRRKRYPQTQNRMVYKDKDHREIIMDDNYHGAVYIGDDDFPAWRKYKPRLLSFSSSGSSYGSGGFSSFISIDTENKYFSMQRPNHAIDITTFTFGNIYYRNTQIGNKVYAYASLNGYDWKEYESSMFLNPSNYIGRYGSYVLMKNDDYYELYEITYDSENNIFSSPTLVGRTIIDYDVQRYLGQISTESYQGALFYYTRQFSTVINLVTGTDFSIQPIFNFRDDTRLVEIQIDDLFLKNNQYMIFIHYMIKSRVPTYNDGSYTSDHKMTVLHSTTGAPDSWEENIVIPQELAFIAEDNDVDRCYYYNQNNNAYMGSTNAANVVQYVLYSNSMYYIYLNYRYPYTSWMNYYKRNNLKYVTGYGNDTIYGYLVAFRSSDLTNWEKCVLPQFLDISFLGRKESNKIIDGYYGYGIMKCSDYDYLRLYLDGTAIGTSPVIYPRIMPSEQIASYAGQHFAHPFTGDVLNTEIINGTIQPSGNLDNNDIWIIRNNMDLYDSDLLNRVWGGAICINIKDPLFQHNEENYVYLLNNSPDEAGTRPHATSNVDPLDPSDYVFG